MADHGRGWRVVPVCSIARQRVQETIDGGAGDNQPLDVARVKVSKAFFHFFFACLFRAVLRHPTG